MSYWTPYQLPFKGPNSEAKVLGIRGRFAQVFDRYEMRRRVLMVQESRQAKHPVTVGASRVAAKGEGEHLEGGFLPLEGKAFDPPKHLVFAGGCGHDCRRNRDRIRGPQRVEFRIPIEVQIQVKVPDSGNALFGAFAAARDEWISRHVDICSAGILVCEPTQITRRKRAFKADGTWTMLPAEKDATRGTWHIAGNQYSSTVDKTYRYTIILLDDHYFIYMDKDAVFIEVRPK